MLVAVEEHLMQVVLEDPEVRVAAETADLALVPDNLEQQSRIATRRRAA